MSNKCNIMTIFFNTINIIINIIYKYNPGLSPATLTSLGNNLEDSVSCGLKQTTDISNSY